MVESNEENKQPSYICEKDGRDHGHIVEDTSWRSVMTEIGHRGEIPSNQLAEALGERQLIQNND